MYPALAVLRALHKLNQTGEGLESVLWVGGESGMEEKLLAQEEVEMVTIPAAGLHGVGFRQLPGNLMKLMAGFFKARGIINSFQPDVLFFTGGYLAVPVALAGFWKPSVVFVPDLKPGLALRTIAALTDQVAVAVQETSKYFSRRKSIQVTGYPVREELLSYPRKAAFQEMNLDPAQPTLLVFGGSKGAQSINRAVSSQLSQLLAEMQIIHISGSQAWEEMRNIQHKLTDQERSRYRLHRYLHREMGAALRCADLVLSRAGASILGEFPRFGVPAVVVPYPHAWDYQMRNARYLADRGAVEVLLDHELKEHLSSRVLALMDDRERREAMAQAMREADRPHAAQSIAVMLYKQTQPEPGGES